MNKTKDLFHSEKIRNIKTSILLNIYSTKNRMERSVTKNKTHIRLIMIVHDYSKSYVIVRELQIVLNVLLKQISVLNRGTITIIAFFFYQEQILCLTRIVKTMIFKYNSLFIHCSTSSSHMYIFLAYRENYTINITI